MKASRVLGVRADLMVTYSLCMIVKDEEEVLARCIESTKGLFDEIIITDTGSRDKTKQIASVYTSKVYDFPWDDDFSAARNFTFSKAGCDFIMWLDADDVILPSDLAALLEFKKSMNAETGTVMMKYNADFDDFGNPTFSYFRERIVKNCDKAVWNGRIHEVITPFPPIVYSEIAISHKRTGLRDPLRNLRIFRKMLAEGEKLNPREHFYYARELYYNAIYKEAAEELERYLEEGHGWTENCIEACRTLAFCYKKLELENRVLPSLFRSFEYDIPRAETCCDIGMHFFKNKGYKAAAYWYERAASCMRDDSSGAFIQSDCYDYIPFLQLCVCHYYLGNKALAEEYNEKAGAVKPDSSSYHYNKIFFKSR